MTLFNIISLLYIRCAVNKVS